MHAQQNQTQKNISLSVLAVPRVKISNLDMTVEENTPFTLMCEAYVPDTGHPDRSKGVNITWFKDGVSIDTNGSKFQAE